jgi:hypothetical protein
MAEFLVTAMPLIRKAMITRDITDPKALALKIAELHGVFNMQALAYDRWRIEDLKRELDAIGCSSVGTVWPGLQRPIARRRRAGAACGRR